jgi:hypothetical protein
MTMMANVQHLELGVGKLINLQTPVKKNGPIVLLPWLRELFPIIV